VGYNAVPDNTGLHFIIASQICEIPWNSPKIQTYSNWRSSRSSWCQ